MARQGAMMLELMRGLPGQNNRAVKRDVDGRNIDEVILELVARESGTLGSVATIRDRLVRCILREDPKNKGKVPWSPTDEAAHDVRQILGLLVHSKKNVTIYIAYARQ